MLNALKQKVRSLTIRKKIVCIMAVVFLCMFGLLCAAFYIGVNSLLLSVSSPHYLYHEGVRFIMTILSVMALCCLAILLIVLRIMEGIIVKPLSLLVREVDGFGSETINPRLSTKFESIEFSALTKAINKMLARLDAAGDVIKKKNRELFRIANYDPLTGLQNRVSCGDSLGKAITVSEANHTLISVFYLNIDRFKHINDAFGHNVGDSFMVAIAQRLRDELKGALAIGRAGGNEYIVIVGDLNEMYKTYAYAGRIISIFQTPFEVKDIELQITVSVGSSTYPSDGQDKETLLKHAEMAMYQAKDLGGNIYCRYERELNKVLRRKLYVENKIRSAVNEGCESFEAYFQPKVSSGSGVIMGSEALIRWVTPEGIISPCEFIPMAEETGLIVPISRWMLKEACRCNKRFEHYGIYDPVSVNISAQVLLHKDFISIVTEAVDETGMDIKRLDIELTEAALLNDIPKVKDVLNALHELGVSISIDDFGTGYSSLSYLKRLPVNRIKVDRSFVMGLEDEDDSDRTIVNAIVSVGKSLHKLVTAEGVEEDRQYKYLKNIQCDEIQGFYISEPVPFEEYISLYKARGSGSELIPFPF